MRQSVEKLPSYLRKYCVEQSGAKYTSRDHAAWRYIMRQSREYFRDHAVPIYLDGLRRTGVTLDRIPLIAEMDVKLQTLGWGAVPVCGFIPPAAFLDFQARRILPIAYDMRSVEHIHYTPAPDIVHEAAGHAPILADERYSEYLTLYATMAQKAIFSQEDLDVYEAIRALSDIKENPDSSKAMIAAAESALTRASGQVNYISEANKVARMNWWTVEYGLLGSLDAPRIYGAGLLSSVSESQNCLGANVKKIRLTIDCVDTTYDITEPQPQLFVAEDQEHLTAVLKEFEQTLSYVRGGTHGLTEAKRGRTVTTTVLDSGIEISGRLDDFETDGKGIEEFVRLSGPVQLAVEGRQLVEHSSKQHPTGFSSPLGRAVELSTRPLTNLSDQELDRLGLSPDKRARLEMTTGFVIEGVVAERVRHAGRLIILKWRDCTVTRGSKVYFEPAWGDFDMAIGERVVSVFGGPADRESYGSHDVGTSTTSPARQSPFTPDELSAFNGYSEIRQTRAKLTGGAIKVEVALAMAEDIERRFPHEWLLRIEAIEVATIASRDLGADAARRLDALKVQLVAATNDRDDNVQWLVRQGLALSAHAD